MFNCSTENAATGPQLSTGPVSLLEIVILTVEPAQIAVGNQTCTSNIRLHAQPEKVEPREGRKDGRMEGWINNKPKEAFAVFSKDDDEQCHDGRCTRGSR